MKYFFYNFFIALLLIAVNCFSQNFVNPEVLEVPVEGKPIPSFVLTVNGYKNEIVSNTDLRGKWLVLGFWYRGCGTSVKSISKLDQIYKKLGAHVNFILIGRNDHYNFGKGIDSLYFRLKKRQSLTIPFAFDSTISNAWGIWSFPSIFIIDPDGITRYITTGLDLTEDKIHAITEGRQVYLEQSDNELPPFQGASIADSSKLLYLSTVSRWNGNRRFIPSVESYFNDYIKAGKALPGIRMSRATLQDILKVAFFKIGIWSRSDTLYYNNFYPVPVLEVEDSSLFKIDWVEGIGFYNYELVIPNLKTEDEVLRRIQKEVCNIFNLEAFVENRNMPIYKLIANSEAGEKLRTKNNFSAYQTNINGDGGAGGFTSNNLPMEIFMDMITKYIDDGSIPYFDHTGIRHNIDITIDALLLDRTQIINALRENGLDLVIGEKKMTVLVIRDVKK